MKKMISLFTASLMTVGMSVPALAADINVTVDSAPVTWTDAKPFIDENSRTLVPLRPIANALGLEVAWNDDTNTASFTDGETTVEFVVGSNEYHAFLNHFDMHTYMEMDTTPVIKDSRIFAPARYLAESFHYAVGWNQAAQTVLITAITDPEEEIIVTPKVPTGELAAAFPVTAAADTWVKNYIAFEGLTLAEDADIFEYFIETETPMNGFGMSYSIVTEGNYIEMDMSADFSTPAGTYPVTFIIPNAYFTDAPTDVVVTTTMTVTDASIETAMEKALAELEYGVETVYGAHAGDIAEAVAYSTEWLFGKTPFQLTLSDGDWCYDSEGNIMRELWECTVTMTNTGTGESVSEPNVVIPLTFDPASA